MPHKEEPSEFTPDLYPPFPSSPDFPTVELQTISLQKLLDHDPTEETRVFDACKGRGFFYLELAGPEEGETILNGSEEIARVGERFMALPTDEKMKFTPNKKELFGYKMLGATKVDAAGTRDNAEFFNISKNDMLVPDEQMRRKWPETILESKALFAKYSRTAHGIGMLVMDVLAQKLGIDPEEIRSRHRIEEHAGDHVRVTRGPPRKTTEMPEIQTPSHTYVHQLCPTGVRSTN
jgi:isopenicillin N synthase-like dioxygenase